MITFTEGTPRLRGRLEEISGYHLFGPEDTKKKKQTIIMVKAKLPFIPSNYDAKISKNQKKIK